VTLRQSLTVTVSLGTGAEQSQVAVTLMVPVTWVDLCGLCAASSQVIAAALAFGGGWAVTLRITRLPSSLGGADGLAEADEVSPESTSTSAPNAAPTYRIDRCFMILVHE
jgi:hypothetical protein